MKSNDILYNNWDKISPELYEVLQTGKLPVNSKRLEKNQPGIYLVMVRVLKKDTNVLVYNYICYHSLFQFSLLAFLMKRCVFNIKNTEYKETGEFLTIFDDVFNVNPSDLSSFISQFNSFVVQSVSIVHYYEIIKLINKLMYLSNYETMSQLLRYGYNNEYSNFISKIVSSIPDFDIEYRLKRTRWEIPISLINSCVFVVNDINLFLASVKDKDLNINQGPSGWRGQVSSMQNILCNLDTEYRNQLYQSNLHDVQSYNLDKRFLLPRSKFSFNNIHMNLGSVRWHSTKTITKRTKAKLI